MTWLIKSDWSLTAFLGWQQEEEKRKVESERLEKEAEEQRQREIDELDKALNQASGSAVAMGRRLNASKQNEAKWKEEASDEEEITQEDLEKWKDSDSGTLREDCCWNLPEPYSYHIPWSLLQLSQEDEERHEREEAEAKRRKIEEEEKRSLYVCGGCESSLNCTSRTFEDA